jgi:hypothetical protein
LPSAAGSTRNFRILASPAEQESKIRLSDFCVFARLFGRASLRHCVEFWRTIDVEAVLPLPDLPDPPSESGALRREAAERFEISPALRKTAGEPGLK